MQETLIKAWRKLDSYNASGPMRAWLYTIATNTSLNLLKSRRRDGVADEADAATGAGRSRAGRELRSARGGRARVPERRLRASGAPARGRSSCATGWAGRRSRSRTCSTPRCPRSTALCSAPAPHSRREATRSLAASTTCTRRCWAPTSRPGIRPTSTGSPHWRAQTRHAPRSSSDCNRSGGGWVRLPDYHRWRADRVRLSPCLHEHLRATALARRAALRLCADAVKRRRDGPLPGGGDAVAPPCPERPQVGPQLAAVVERGAAVAGLELVALDDVRDRPLDEPERDAMRAARSAPSRRSSRSGRGASGVWCAASTRSVPRSITSSLSRIARGVLRRYGAAMTSNTTSGGAAIWIRIGPSGRSRRPTPRSSVRPARVTSSPPAASSAAPPAAAIRRARDGGGSAPIGTLYTPASRRRRAVPSGILAGWRPAAPCPQRRAPSARTAARCSTPSCTNATGACSCAASAPSTA